MAFQGLRGAEVGCPSHFCRSRWRRPAGWMSAWRLSPWVRPPSANGPSHCIAANLAAFSAHVGPRTVALQYQGPLISKAIGVS